MFYINKRTFGVCVLLYVLLVTCGKRASTGRTFSNFVKDGALIGAKFDTDNLGVLAFGESFILIGYKARPYLLTVTPEFDLDSVSVAIRDSLRQVKVLNIQPFFVGKKDYGKDCCRLSSSINEFSSLKMIKFENVDIDGMFILVDLPLEYLVLERVRIREREAFITKIGELKKIRYLVHDQLFSRREIEIINELAPHLTVLEMSEYEQKFKSGEFTL